MNSPERQLQSGERLSGRRTSIRKGSCIYVLADDFPRTLSEQELQRWLEEFSSAMFAPKHARGSSPAAGRGSVRAITVDNQCTAFVRAGARGGLMGKMQSSWYVKLPWVRFRVFEELALLQALRESEVSVPEPLAAVVDTRMLGALYRSAIATRQIPGAENLFVLAKRGSPEEELLHWSERAGQEASAMLRAGVYHPDLHLANILVGNANVSLVDFDKAFRFVPGKKTCERYARSLISRFERFTVKYQLTSPDLVAAFRRGLCCNTSGKCTE